MKQYLAILHKDDGSDYGVSFPDFPGCVAAGKDLYDAQANAIEALAFHIEGMIEDGDTIPDPSDIADIAVEDGGIVIVVPYQAEAKFVRINISVRDDLLALIDNAAEAEGMTRSSYFVFKATPRSTTNLGGTKLSYTSKRAAKTGSFMVATKKSASTKKDRPAARE